MKDPIDKELFKKYIAEELENVSGLKKQITDEQIDKLNESDYTKDEILVTLHEMENHKPLQKKYVSLYLTLLSWMRLKRQKEQRFKEGQLKRLGMNSRMSYEEALAFLERKGIPLAQLDNKFTRELDPNGKYYFTLKGN